VAELSRVNKLLEERDVQLEAKNNLIEEMKDDSLIRDFQNHIMKVQLNKKLLNTMDGLRTLNI